jgi:hypothetical protein
MKDILMNKDLVNIDRIRERERERERDENKEQKRKEKGRELEEISC